MRSETPKCSRQVLGLERLMSMRTLGKIFVDERESVTELRRILKEMLSEELDKAIKTCRESAKITAIKAAAASGPAPAAREHTCITLYVLCIVHLVSILTRIFT